MLQRTENVVWGQRYEKCTQERALGATQLPYFRAWGPESSRYAKVLPLRYTCPCTQESLAVLNESAIDIKCEIRSTRARHGICDSVNATA